MIAIRLARPRLRAFALLPPAALLMALVIAAVALLPAPADAQIPLGPSRLSLEARFNSTHVAPGQEVTLELHVQMQEHWHLYGNKEELGVPPFLDLARLPPWLEPSKKLQIPDGEREELAPGMVSHWLKGKFVLRQRFRVTASPSPASMNCPRPSPTMPATPTCASPRRSSRLPQSWSSTSLACASTQ